ncbi:hypothetical protein PHO31112_00806 [Pandoraea horticolens]|uniref:Tail fiber protein n=1 Tax=Pandoraea horticolens TaxID=2508298 RepID=A0A5E4SLP4_9BURK|nr:hypothetical protein PHO31112_00806 [Pandoraea horticolens]
MLAGAGITPDRNNNAQVVTAIRRLVQSKTVLADTGAANAYAATNTPALTALPASGFVQVLSVANGNTGASTYAADGLAAKPILGMGLAPLQGGEMPAKGLATLLYIVASTVNSGNGAWVLIECSGGAQQISPGTAPQHAVQLGQVSGVIGSSRNLAMNVATASSTATVTANELIVETSLGGLRYCLAAFSKSINLATTGAGGMDVGSAPASGFVGIYAIYNPTSGTSALLATNATSSAVSEVYGGANMPTGYTASALVAVVPTNASGQISPLLLQGRRVAIINVSVLSTSSQPASFTAFSIASAVPLNAINASVLLQVSNTTNAASESYDVSPTSSGINRVSVSGQSVGTSGNTISTSVELSIATPQTLYYKGGGGTPLLAVSIGAYSF